MSFWKYRNVFVTGCTGLLGSWLTKKLQEEGANVVGLIRDWVPGSNLILKGTIDKIVSVRGEIEDYRLLERVIHEYEIDTVFHLAAQTVVGTANNSPLGTFESNIKGTWNLLEAARSAPKISRVVVASSDKAYGDQKKLPYTESTPLKGLHPYDVSKSCADLLCHAYFESYKLPVSITRCGNFYGGGDLNFNRVVPGTIASLIKNEDPIIRSDGNFIRDYIHVDDGVNAYMHLAQKMDDKKIHGEAFNFSYEKPQSVLDIVNNISSLMQSKRKPKILNQAVNEIRDQHLSSEKARTVLDWKPTMTMEKGLEGTIQWYKKYFGVN